MSDRSLWSIRSRNSILSIASEGSILSVGSIGSVASVGGPGRDRRGWAGLPGDPGRSHAALT